MLIIRIESVSVKLMLLVDLRNPGQIWINIGILRALIPGLYLQLYPEL